MPFPEFTFQMFQLDFVSWASESLVFLSKVGQTLQRGVLPGFDGDWESVFILFVVTSTSYFYNLLI